MGGDGTSTTLFFGPWYRRSPYFEATQRHGCRAYDLYNKMYIPSHYVSDPVEEYWHLLNHVTLWDVSVERQVEIAGPDAFRFTSYLTPRDLRNCKVGQAKYVVLCDARGGIVNDPVLTRLREDRFWLSTADSDVLLWAKGVAINAGMDVDISEPDVSPLQLQGPQSKDVVRDLFGPRALELPYYHFMEANLEGIPVVLTRTGWSAEVGYEIYLLDGNRGVELWEKVLKAGQPYDIRPTGPSDIRRIEAGILNYPSDINLDTNPFEVGLDRILDLDKREEFIGREALKKIKKEGAKRKLVGVEVQGDPSPDWLPWLPAPLPVLRGGKRIGTLTALGYSPRLKKNIGYAMVPVEHSRLGTSLTLRAPSGDRQAAVASLPFVDPRKDIPKS